MDLQRRAQGHSGGQGWQGTQGGGGGENGFWQNCATVASADSPSNPHWDPKLKPLSGLDLAVQEYLGKNVMCLDMFQKIRDFVEYWLPQFINDNRNYITVAIGCTGGQHRSVFMSTLLCEYFSKSNLVLTQVRHRELDL